MAAFYEACHPAFMGPHAVGNAADSLLVMNTDWKVATGSPTIDVL